MKIAAQRRRRRSPSTSRSASKLRTGARRRCARAHDVHEPEVLAVEHDQPRAAIRARERPRAARSRSGSARPSRSTPSVIVVDSPPGITSPSRPSRSDWHAHLPRPGAEPRSASAGAPRSRPAARARRSAARAPSAPPGGPTSRAGPGAARPQSLELSRLTIAGAEAAGGLRDALGVLPVGRRLDDRAGARRRVLGLEDARADEHALGAERHHQRRVGRRGDAAGAEQHDRQARLRCATSRTRSSGAASSLAAVASSSSRERRQPADFAA